MVDELDDTATRVQVKKKIVLSQEMVTGCPHRGNSDHIGFKEAVLTEGHGDLA